CEEHLPGQNIHAVLKENIIDKLRYDYDFIFLDSGPHLDAFLKNCIGAADLMLSLINISEPTGRCVQS
ncbi:AAA family ATPase, partial [Salmonella enterica subsp. enterica serovar Paratyphi B]|uniref:ParA family protein n=1 Tax=Salmonella enterica TaxID=28901 RepID=UPI0030C7908D